MKLIGFLAISRSGKDTCADHLVQNYGYTKMSFAEPLKKMCAIAFGFNQEQLHGDLKEVVDESWGITPRLALQYLGTDVFRKDITKIVPNIGDNFWINCFKVNYFIELQKNPDFKCVISDVRFQNEVDLIKTLGGVVIKLERPTLDPNRVYNHESERGISLIKNYNYLLVNDKTKEELYEKLDNLM